MTVTVMVMATVTVMVMVTAMVTAMVTILPMAIRPPGAGLPCIPNCMW